MLTDGDRRHQPVVAVDRPHQRLRRQVPLLDCAVVAGAEQFNAVVGKGQSAEAIAMPIAKKSAVSQRVQQVARFQAP